VQRLVRCILVLSIANTLELRMIKESGTITQYTKILKRNQSSKNSR